MNSVEWNTQTDTHTHRQTHTHTHRQTHTQTDTHTHTHTLSFIYIDNIIQFFFEKSNQIISIYSKYTISLYFFMM